MAAIPRLARDRTRARGRARGARVSARPRGEPRLDPVRWRRPGAGTLIRLTAVAALLSVAAVLLWSGPSGFRRPGDGRSASGALSGAAACVARPGASEPAQRASGPGSATSGTERAASGPGPPSAGPSSGPAAASGSASVAAGDGAVPGGGVAVSAGGVGAPPGGVAVPPGGVTVPAGGVAVPPGGVGVPTGSVAVPAGSVGVPVRLAEPTALALVHAGDRVDLLRVDDSGLGTSAVAADALVLSVTRSDDVGAGGLLVALRPADAAKAAAPGRGFAVLVRPG